MVARQYTGTAGRIENAQVGVFLAYAASDGSRALIDLELYLPESSTTYRVPSRAAGIADEVAFATKPKLAQDMVERALKAGVPFAWIRRRRGGGDNLGLRQSPARPADRLRDGSAVQRADHRRRGPPQARRRAGPPVPAGGGGTGACRARMPEGAAAGMTGRWSMLPAVITGCWSAGRCA